MSDDRQVEPDELLGEGDGDGDDEEEMEVSEYFAAMFTDILETGLPLRFTAHAADPFVRPLLRRLEHQNALLHELNVTLRAIAKRQGTELPPMKVGAELPPLKK